MLEKKAPKHSFVTLNLVSYAVTDITRNATHTFFSIGGLSLLQYNIYLTFVCNLMILRYDKCDLPSLTHWGRVTHICVAYLTIIASDNGLSPSRRQAIIRTNAGLLLIGPLGTNFNENLIEILTFSFKKMRLKMSSGKWRPFCHGLNVLNAISRDWEASKQLPETTL